MRKVYTSPELDIFKLRAEDIMAQVDPSTPQGFEDGGDDSHDGDF